MFNFFNKKFKDETLAEQRADVEKYPDAKIKTSILSGEDCDQVKHATGEFGRTPTNPIPVNGLPGEIKYLNRLRGKGGGLIFHRLGSFPQEGFPEALDVYETVSVDGSNWDVLYLDMYHPRRSTLLPSGYSASEFHEIYSRSAGFSYGVNKFDKDFPFGVPDLIETMFVDFGKSIAKRLRVEVSDRNKFIRPKEQEQRLSVANKILEHASLSFKDKQSKDKDVYRFSNEDMKTLQTFYQKNDLDGAIKFLWMKDKQHRNSPDVFYHMAHTLRLMGRFDEAIQIYLNALTLDPYEKTTWYGLAIAYQLAGDYRSSIHNFEQLINKHPTFIEAYNSLGLTHKKAGDLTNALKYYNQGIEAHFQNIYDEIKRKPVRELDNTYASTQSSTWMEVATQIAIKNSAKDGIKNAKFPTGETALNMSEQNPIAGRAFYDDGDTRHVLPAYFSAIYQGLRSNLLYSILVNNSGTIFGEEGDKVQAARCFKEAIEFTPSGVKYDDPILALRALE